MAVSEKEAARLQRLLEPERRLLARGVRVIAGADEAGRGPLAGPVVAACVMLPLDALIPGVNDSKRVSEARREKIYRQIMEQSHGVGIGMVSAEEIDEINILNATRKAFTMAAGNLPRRPEHILCDAISGVDFGCPATSLVHGDALSYLIAAASIVAKVTRDNLMREYDALYPQYGFSRHKGYGTKEHQAALKVYGACPLHRRTFITRFV